jgi:hypothetical protein
MTGKRGAPGGLRDFLLVKILRQFKGRILMSGIKSGESPEQPNPTATAVHWDQTQMRTEFSNVINVLSAREEFSLLFGMNSTWSLAEGKGFEVKLSNRMVLTPYAAKRLNLLLTERLAEYEAKYGVLDLGT